MQIKQDIALAVVDKNEMQRLRASLQVNIYFAGFLGYQIKM
jgi:hypothetical protein